MRRLLLLLPALAALAVAAAGCGGGSSSSFADCSVSASRGTDEDTIAVLPRTYDCLVRAYRAGCRPARARIGVSGVDTGSELALRLYRRGSRCAGDVTSTFFFMGSRRKPVQHSCRQAYLFGGKLSLFGCGGAGGYDFARGRDCRRVFALMRLKACRRAGKKCPPLPAAREFPVAC